MLYIDGKGDPIAMRKGANQIALYLLVNLLVKLGKCHLWARTRFKFTKTLFAAKLIFLSQFGTTMVTFKSLQLAILRETLLPDYSKWTEPEDLEICEMELKMYRIIHG